MDFGRLLDPEMMAQARAKRIADEQLQADKDSELQRLLERCLAVEDQLSGRELELVMSCRSRMRSFRAITGPQEQWLRDIVARHYGKNGT